MKKARWSRRDFSRFLGLGALCAPFLSTLRAEAQTSPVKRIVFFTTPNGTVMDEFFPDASGAYRRILAPLAAHKPRLQVIRGVDLKSALKTPIPKDHIPDYFNMLTAIQPTSKDGGAGESSYLAGGPSIDQHIATALVGKTKYKSIHLGVKSLSGYMDRISFTGPGAPVAPVNDPAAAFNTYFSTLVVPPAQADLQRQERQSILDTARADLNALRCTVGTPERAALDAHLEGLRELERELQNSMVPGATCKAPTPGGALDYKADANFPEVGKRQMDIIAAAIGCDLSRVFTLQWGAGSSNITHAWASVANGHHEISHASLNGITAADQKEWLTRIDTWYATQLKYLLDRLELIKEGTASALDNTVVVWCHEQADGSKHQRTDHPYLLAGSCAGALKLGAPRSMNGQPHGRMLTTLATAMGVPTPSFGDSSLASNPFTDLLT